ncbi:hypothetical protein ACFL23_02775 [Patescibacteria group bacterium]
MINGGSMIRKDYRKRKKIVNKREEENKIFGKGTYYLENIAEPDICINKLRASFERLYVIEKMGSGLISNQVYRWDDGKGYILLWFATLKNNIIITDGHILLRDKKIGRHIWHQEITFKKKKKRCKNFSVEIDFYETEEDIEENYLNSPDCIKSHVAICLFGNINLEQISIIKKFFEIDIFPNDDEIALVKKV